MPITFPDLPYAMDALEPAISARTLEFHHGKHHKTYVDKTNDLIKETPLADQGLPEIVKEAAMAGNQGLFNNAAQAWNHDFFWHCMKPGGGGKPRGTIAAKLEEHLGGYDRFATAFKEAGATQFGSGWAWLILKDGKLQVAKTPNAETPLTNGARPLLVVDVWEHAYYLDYQNRRPDFIQAFLDQLVNWDFVNENLA